MKKSFEMSRVLVIDDEPIILMALARVLKEQNIEVEVAGNGRIALEALRRQQYHAVLCDIMMPEMNGLDLLVQCSGAGISAPFIFVTGFGDESLMLQAIRLGATDFIRKPFDVREITDVVFRTMEIGKRRDRIMKGIAEADPQLFKEIEKEEKYISLMRVFNNSKAG